MKAEILTTQLRRRNVFNRSPVFQTQQCHFYDVRNSLITQEAHRSTQFQKEKCNSATMEGNPGIVQDKKLRLIKNTMIISIIFEKRSAA
jgi:hypothetical protein